VIRPKSRSGIVLAGGRARRFGTNKLEAVIVDRPILQHAIDALAPVVGEIIVSVAAGASPPMVPGLRAAPAVRWVMDPAPDGGPLVGLAAALEAVSQPIAVVVAGDMPALRTELLALLCAELEADPTVDAVVLRDDDIAPPLPCALRVAPAGDAAIARLADEDRSLRGLISRLRTRSLPESRWRTVDREGDWRVDVDRPEDLERARQRLRGRGHTADRERDEGGA
jgi:molybdopterin-guanine dinucleotide biosynthesis protein A